MSLFDFLTQPAAQAENAFSSMGQGADVEAPNARASGLLQPPAQMPEKPGFLERFGTPNDQGVSWADKLYAIGGVLNGDGEGGMSYLQGKAKDYRAQKLLEQAQADKARKNAAFKAAYQNGKFDPGVYASNLGESDVDPSDIAQLTRALAPQGGVDSGRAYTKDPVTGAVTWGDVAPENAADRAKASSEAERERHNRITEDYILRGLGIKQQTADAGTYRAHKAPAGGGATGLPPGYVPR